MKFVYYCFTFAYGIPLSFYFFWQSWFRGKGEIERLGRNLPALNGASNQRLVWLVASSVGEVVIALRLVSALRDRGVRTILSVTTAAGRKQAIESSLSPDAVFYHPLDLPHVVRRVISFFNPDEIVLVETELWPVLLEIAAESGIPVVQASGSISPRSFRRYRALKPYFGQVLASSRALLMQTEQDAHFASELTDGRTEVEVMGSLKEEYSPPDPEKLKIARDRLAAWDRMVVWACGSTRPGEEKLLLSAFAKLRESYPNLRMILAPRHLDRVAEVKQLIAESQFSYAVWSEASQVALETDLLFVDEIGWLNAIYHLSQLAFVGGTLVPIGGHNLLEPAFAGIPVIYGPHHSEQQVGHELLQQYKLGFVTEPGSLSETVAQLLAELAMDHDFHDRGTALRERGGKVVADCVEKILSLIAERD